MEFYYSANVWDQKFCPNTSKLAKSTHCSNVSSATVIKVEGGKYRSAVFSGIFALDVNMPTAIDQKGWTTAIFFCRWFGHLLQNRSIKIKFNSANHEIINSYSGEVVSNLAS
jgi:hypothetical protein